MDRPVYAALSSARGIRIASYVMTALALLLVLRLHLLPALLAGLLVYELVHAMTPSSLRISNSAQSRTSGTYMPGSRTNTRDWTTRPLFSRNRPNDLVRPPAARAPGPGPSPWPDFVGAVVGARDHVGHALDAAVRHDLA